MMTRAPWRSFDTYLRLHRAIKLSHDDRALPAVLVHLGAAAGLDREEKTKAAVVAALTGDLGTTCTVIERHRTGTPLATLPASSPLRARPLKAERVLAALAHYASTARLAGGFVPLIAEQLTGDVGDDRTTVARLFAAAPGATPRTGLTITRMLSLAAGWDLDDDGPGCLGDKLPALTHTGLDHLAPTANRESAERLFTLLVADTAAELNHPFGQGLDPHGVADTLTSLQRLHSGTYYVGMRIDQMQADLIRSPRGLLTDQAWTSRAACLPQRYLGERGGWYGPVSERKAHFRTTGHIAVRRAAA